MEDHKITKIQKLKEVNNDMCHNFYYLVYFRLYNKEHTHYKHGKFVIWFDIFDVQEFYLEEDETRGVTKDEIKQYASEIAISTFETYYKSYEKTEDLQEFCKSSIEDYNKTNCRCW